jgi:cytochrome b
MTTSDRSRSAPAEGAVLVWDLPTRLFHWLLALSFFGAYIVSEGERWRGVHALLGYTAGGLIAFRLLWGLVGTRYARFSSFSLAPAAVIAYLRSLVTSSPQHHVGHNPAGSWAVLALLSLVAATAVSGWAVLNDIGPEWLDEVHELFANATIALVALHVAAVVVSSLIHRENLVRAMVTGGKRAAGAVAASGPRRVAALAMLAVLLAFWGGWIPAPGIERGTGLAAMPTVTADAQHAKHRSDDD